MGKTLSDKVQALTLEAVVLNPKTVNTFKDNTTLSPEELAVANNVIFDNGVIEKVPGTTVGNSDVSTGPILGLHRAYGKSTEKKTLKHDVGVAMVQGSMATIPDAFTTATHAHFNSYIMYLNDLTRVYKTSFINVKGKAYGINEADGIIRYNPTTDEGMKTGIVGPYYRKKVAFFESNETWTGGYPSSSVYRPDEWSGNAQFSYRITATTSSSTTAQSSIAINLAVFDDGKVSSIGDYICFWIHHDILNNIDHLDFDLSVGNTAFTKYFGMELTQSKFTTGDYEWTLFQCKKATFTKNGGAVDGDWSNIDAIRFIINTNANGPVTLHIDFCYLKNAPPQATERRFNIVKCDNSETWTGTRSGIFNDQSYDEHYGSLRFTGTGAGTATTTFTSKNLSLWPDGTNSAVSDQIVFYVRTNDTATWNNTNPLILQLGTDASNYYTYTWATKTALGIQTKDIWWEVRVAKSAFSTGAGTPNWSTIAYINIITSAITGTTKYVYIDDVHMEKANQITVLADMESDETWAITGNGEMSPDHKFEGALCLRLYSGKVTMSVSYGVTTFATDKDLTQWSDSTASTTDDLISFWLYHTNYNNIEYVELWLDCNSTDTFADAFYYKIDKSEFAQKSSNALLNNNIGTEIVIAKSKFERVGATAGAGWDKIKSIKFLVSSKGLANTSSVYIDYVVMKRKNGLTGRYYYKYTFMAGNVESALSELSNAVDSKGSHISVTNIATSYDDRVIARKIYRLGGEFSTTWMLVKTIGDNTTTEFVDDLGDNDLAISMDDNVPQGNINIVTGNNLAYDPQSDRVLTWGESAYKNRVRYSRPAFYHVMDETGYRDFPDHVVGVVPWYGQNIIFFRHTIKKVMGDLLTGELVDLPVNVGCCSHWAFCKGPMNLIPFVGWDNVYIFDGYKANPIGDAVKNYFIGKEQYLSTLTMIYHKDAIYIAMKDGTQAYNNICLRYYIPTKSWSVMPNWNINVWSAWNSSDDQNELWYGDSSDSYIYRLDSSTYSFDTAGIASTIGTGWFNVPDGELALHRVEFKAKGTAGGILSLNGYINHSAIATSTGGVALTASWKSYTYGPKNVWNKLRGDNIKIEFTHSTNDAYFKIKDIVLYFEKLSKRITLDEVIVS